MGSKERTGLGTRVLTAVGAIAVALVLFNIAGFDPIGDLRGRLFGVEQRPEAAGTTLLTIRRTSELRSATGEFSVPVYFGTDQDGVIKQAVPDVLDGDSGVAIYQGSVDAFVDLSKLTTDDLTINRSDRSLAITVPEPRLSSPNIDQSKSKVVTQSRGLATRLGDLFDDAPLRDKEELDEVAVAEISKAAEESNLEETAKDNAREFLEGLGERLGYDQVDVEFTGRPQP